MSAAPEQRGRDRFDFTAPLPAAGDLGRVHFIAIGGAGVSGVALLLLQAGLEVSGSDAVHSATLQALAAAGATVHVGHDPSHLGRADTVIISGAVSESNVELAAARERGLRVLHRAQGIAALSQDRDAVAVAGANGKTTTSAMVVACLAADGSAPGFVIGSVVAQFGASAQVGVGPMVIEADESDGSFVAYRPRVAIVTNVTPDHLDFYGDFAGVQRAFDRFVQTLGPDGLLVANADDPGSAALTSRARSRGQRVLTWGRSPEADVQVSGWAQQGRTSTATLTWRSDVGEVAAQTVHRLSVPMPGAHNVENAVAALLAATAGYGRPVEEALTGLSHFAGTRRRFEWVAEAGGVEIIDDYAHNPQKVAAAVSAGRSVVKAGGRLVVAFQPHLYSRTADFAEQFAEALSGADVVVVLDVFGAREAPMPGVSGALITEAMVRRHRDGSPQPVPQVHYVAERGRAAGLVASLVRPRDVLITVGAGNVTTLGPEVTQLLERTDA
ncbi:MAG: UDP-N-acetylmuramate--L-alanine ligase [Ornithinimicrobium sp.]